jgi:hypothetical protein
MAVRHQEWPLKRVWSTHNPKKPVSGQPLMMMMIMTVMMQAYCGLRCVDVTCISSPRLTLTVSGKKKYFLFLLVEVKYETNFE